MPRQTDPPARRGGPSATAAALSILRTAAWLLDELEPTFAAHHTTAIRFDILDALTQLGRPARPVELKELLHVPAQTVTGVLDALERTVLIRRKPHPTDRRSVLVELTPAGTAAVEELCPPLIAVEEACMAGLSSAQLDTLVQLLALAQSSIRARALHSATVSAGVPQKQ
jgi:DNA-binding MarR family transcriptional regulator